MPANNSGWRRANNLVPAMGDAADGRLYHAHVARNRQPILDVLARVLPRGALVLEIASGSGEHAVFFAQHLPLVRWQPTDTDGGALASIAAHRAGAALPNLLEPLHLNAAAQRWPVESADALVCNNMIHITPWRITEGLMAGAGRTLPNGGILYLYGPYRYRWPPHRAEQRRLRCLAQGTKSGMGHTRSCRRGGACAASWSRTHRDGGDAGEQFKRHLSPRLTAPFPVVARRPGNIGDPS